MPNTLERIRELARMNLVRVSAHGYEELADDGLFADEIVANLAVDELLEDYPAYAKGPCVLLMGHTKSGTPYHAVWGIPKGSDAPAVLVTAYVPSSDRWSTDFRSRK